MNIQKKQKLCSFSVTKISDIHEKIIPFFVKYPIQSSKLFKGFCLVGELMNNKLHLTTEGLEQIREIKDRMNRKRDYSLS